MGVLRAFRQATFKTTFDTIGAELITFTCPTALADNGEYVVTVERTDTNNVTRISKGEKVTALPAGVAAPTITAAGTVGDEPGTVNVSGATLEVKGTNIADVTQVQLLTLPAGEVWQTVNVTWDSEGERLLAELDLDSPPTSNGAVSITTPGGNATFEVTYESH